MKINLSTMLFYLTLTMGTMISITSSSWLIMWMGLEMNLMSFIPIMNKEKTPYESEASMKYFLVQAMASMIMLMAVLTSEMMEDSYWNEFMLISALIMKMGAPPFHMWFPTVMQGLEWSNCFLLMTWQKIATMVMVGYIMSNSTFINLIIILSVTVGAMSGINQTSIRKMMAYSSISHLGWMLSAMLLSNLYWTIYFIIYTILNIATIIIMHKYSLFQIQQIFNLKMSTMAKFTMFTSMLSLAGLPPFLGFLPKWMIIQNMVMYQEYSTILIMVMTTLLTLYFYLRTTYSAFTLKNQEEMWMNENENKNILISAMMISLSGIPLITIINLY